MQADLHELSFTQALNSEHGGLPLMQFPIKTGQKIVAR
jgi:hypothetical protein